MADIDEDRLELLERRLADNVAARVRPALFRVYAAMGATAIAILGYVGWNVINDTKEHIQQHFQDQVDTFVQSAKGKIDTSERELQKELLKMEALQERGDKLFAEIDDKLRGFGPKVEILDQLSGKVEELDRRRKEIEATLERTSSTAATAEDLPATVQSLAEQVKRLNERVDDLDKLVRGSAAAPASQTEVYRDIASKVGKVIDSAQATQAQITAVRERPTVYIQFTGAPRAQAQTFAQALGAKGYIVPGPDQQDAAQGKHEVRYFYLEDQAAAKRLAEEAMQVLRSMGQAAPVQIDPVSLVNYPGVKPRPGVLELWLQLPPQ